ncbi:hypothetical protein psyc5s11_19610 [Clostridium gelidum]|uniref:Uncharacterized protein n=2 Tax=Clostridium gelidum TaxID=704125 RepID=A0ABM7T3N0_9CLOT|nr:hypothetical protein psyc5s11_19610 [Clostridium gelidum]
MHTNLFIIAYPCISITLGTLWEMIEFLADYFFKADMVNGGLEDTATDLLIKIFFAFITSIIWYYRKMKKKENELSRYKKAQL